MAALFVDPSLQTQDESKCPLQSPQHSLGSPCSDDMNEILAPSMEDDEYVDFTDQSAFLDTLSTIHTNYSLNNTFSADDSILRRVEQEILAARGESEKENSYRIILNSTISNDDMEQILQTLTSVDKEENCQPEVVMGEDFSFDGGSTQHMAVASDTSFDHVMDMIDREFKDNENAIEETFLGTSELFIHQEAQEDEETNAPGKGQEQSPSKHGLIDGLVELLSQGLLRVNLTEEDVSKMEKDLPARKKNERLDEQKVAEKEEQQTDEASPVLRKNADVVEQLGPNVAEEEGKKMDEDLPVHQINEHVVEHNVQEEERKMDEDLPPHEENEEVVERNVEDEKERKMDEDLLPYEENEEVIVNNVAEEKERKVDEDLPPHEENEEAIENNVAEEKERKVDENLPPHEENEDKDVVENNVQDEEERTMDEERPAQEESEDSNEDVAEEEKSMNKDLPGYQESEDGVELVHDAPSAGEIDPSSEYKAEAFLESHEPQHSATRVPQEDQEEVERLTKSDVSKVNNSNSLQNDEADDQNDEEQAVAKWAQLLAESSIEGVDTATTASVSMKSNSSESESPARKEAFDDKSPKPLSCKPPPSPSPRLVRQQGLGPPPSSPASAPRSLREVRKRHSQQSLNTPRKEVTNQALANSDEQTLLTSSRKLRFRKKFPALKPGRGPRPNEKIIQSHSHGIPSPPTMWIKPKTELKQLIVAAMGTSLQRRSNACGALKVLSLHKKNQLSLARTDTFLTALVFAISQDILDSDRELSTTARMRALTCLRNVSLPKENRVHVFTQPGLVECLVNVIHTEKGESRVLACTTLALLAKSPECREGLGVVHGLVDCLSRVVGRIISSSEDDPLDEASADDADDDCSTESGSQSDAYSDSTSESSDGSRTDSSHSSAESDGDAGSDSNSRTEDAEEETDIEVQNEPIDNDVEKLHQDARLHACAALVHLSRSCAISHILAKNKTLLRTCVKVAMEITNPIHSKCLEILRNLTLFPGNNSLLSRADGVITAFTASANSQYPENRLSALRALQNISGDAASKAILASPHVLHLLTSCAIRKDPNEKEAAVATLYNITTEPSTVVAITNTKNVVATLVHIAHHTESSSQARLLACEALATISLWLQTLAGTGKCPENVPNVLLPSHKTYGWERWD